MWHTESDFIVKILLTICLSSFLGFEREYRQKGAGLRTHILLGVGSSLFTLTSLYLFKIYGDKTQFDPTRMITGIVTGIGFLCGGTIIRAGSHVKGLTTAATLWIVSGIGIAVGAGHYMAAIFVTAVVFLVLTAVNPIEKKFRQRIRKKRIKKTETDKR